MRNFLLLLLVLNMLFMVACKETEETFNKNKDPVNKQPKYEEDQYIGIESVVQEKELPAIINILSGEFVEAHTTGDKKALEKLLSDGTNLIEKDNKLYLTNTGDDFEWFLFDSQSEITLHDWKIQGYAYDNEEETFLVHVREYFYDKNGIIVSPPTFLNLTFKLQASDWEIISVVFDV
ncbi:hypothetical protein KGF86_06470 [Ornithinibacillus massiliensis]|uniref:DUF3993 domain-containing protein n=1 Tax=Ornithinibacillus massiliensis TaxID=1944633 RepID=A0ABS5MBZ4_9BACI|nr:hypothetical protein [Ornithinibacillus massiliensis]MBS3679851.1 hypothetical protein [Ornithinibacillus massiliensis]